MDGLIDIGMPFLFGKGHVFGLIPCVLPGVISLDLIYMPAR